MQKSEIFFWALAAVITGVFVASFFSFSFWLQLLLIVLAIFSAIFAKKLKHSFALLIFIIIAGFSIGIIRSEWYFKSSTFKSSEIFVTPYFLRILRESFERVLESSLPDPESSLAAGIILGRSANFSSDFLEALRRTGTLHIIAVSGYNITIVAANVQKFFELLRIPLLISWWGAVLAVILFTLLVGAPASAVRAAIMGIVVLIGKRIGRASSQRLALTFAAFLMLFWRPDLLRFDLGFQLSFLATIGIFWMAPLVEDKILRKKRLWGLEKIFSETLAAQILVSPWLLYKFGNLSTFGIFANLIILPLLPLAMFLSFITAIAGFFSETASLIIAPAAYLLLAFMVGAIRNVSAIPFAYFQSETFPLWLIILVYAIIFMILVKYYKNKNAEFN